MLPCRLEETNGLIQGMIQGQSSLVFKLVSKKTAQVVKLHHFSSALGWKLKKHFKPPPRDPSVINLPKLPSPKKQRSKDRNWWIKPSEFCLGAMNKKTQMINPTTSKQPTNHNFVKWVAWKGNLHHRSMVRWCHLQLMPGPVKSRHLGISAVLLRSSKWAIKTRCSSVTLVFTPGSPNN